MGALMSGGVWLLDLAKQGDKQRAIVRRLLTTRHKLENRTGHRLDLDAEQVRRGIVHSAHWGHVSRVPVRCLHCNATANLTDWDLLGHMGVEEHRQLAASASISHRAFDYLYIQRCPGAELARIIAQTETAPAEREG